MHQTHSTQIPPKKGDWTGLHEKLVKMAMAFKERDEWVIVTNYDSVLGDAELIVEWPDGAKRQTIEELFTRLAKECGVSLRTDGKVVVLPKNIRVFSITPQGKIKLSKVKALLKNTTTKKILEVKTRIGSIKVTEDHSIIGLENERLEAQKPETINWVCTPRFFPPFNKEKIIDLESNRLFSKLVQNRNGTFVLCGRSIIEKNMQVDEELMTFFGLWVADGCYHNTKGGTGIHVSAYGDHECANIIKSVFKRFGSKGATIVDSGITAIVQSKTLYQTMRHLGFEGKSYTKRIPPWVFGMHPKLIAALLSGYFSGDGTVSKGDINATTFSEGLCRDIQTLLLFFGIRSCVRMDSKNGNDGYKISINATPYKRIFYNQIGFLQEYKREKIKFAAVEHPTSIVPIGKKTLQLLYEKTGKKQFWDELLRRKKAEKITRPMLQRIVSECNDSSLEQRFSTLFEQDLEFEPKKECRTVSNGTETTVYDIETEEGNFICNNIVLKNSDGITAGAILAKTLQRLNKRFQTKVLKQLYSETIPEIQEMGKNYFFLDFGSGQLDFLQKTLGDNFFVLDHHQSQLIKHAFHCNPLLYGFDGGQEVSASGMAFLFSQTVDPKNMDLAALAIVGAVGDMQDEHGSLTGLNQKIAKIGINAKVLEKRIDLRLYGRISRPLTQFLLFASNPILPELTAHEKNCIQFLQELKIDLRESDKWVSYEMLSPNQKKVLSSALIVHLYEHRVPEWKIQKLIGEVYSLPHENNRSPLYDVKEFATLLNSTGRHNRAEIGLQICLGDREEAYAQALSLLAQHRKQLREGIQFLQEQGIQEKKQYYFFDAETNISDSIVGIVAGMLYGSGTIGFQKPIIALARYPEGQIKVSGRATQELIRKGLNLGNAFKEICAELKGKENVGGGHRIAAGAKIEAQNQELFLELLEHKIESQFQEH
ncbi:hypothetical protein KKE06_05020 [Candidatus Micrarchaeota archaeon]|nr:hypothetical protein [Candidatus Micrarchaeota archaeon]MBU1930240.1 hypothetical protein [Candidatus Micrarchaeota archaeon]